MEKRQRTRLMSVLIVALVFGAGFVVGIAFDRTAMAGPVAVTAEAEEGSEAEAEAEDDDRRDRRRRGPMYKRVGDLTAEQEARIDSIVDEHRTRMDALQKEFQESYNPRYYEIVGNTREAIQGVMTDEQAQRYDSLIGEWERRRRDRAKDDSRNDSTPRSDSSRN